MRIPSITNTTVLLEDGDSVAVDKRGYLLICSDGLVYKSVNPLPDNREIPESAVVNSAGNVSSFDDLGWINYKPTRVWSPSD